MELPPLQLSSGPAVSEAGGSTGAGFTGDFFFKRDPAWVDLAKSALPVVAVLGAVWWLTRR
jgi:hypothetical protein